MGEEKAKKRAAHVLHTYTYFPSVFLRKKMMTMTMTMMTYVVDDGGGEMESEKEIITTRS